MKWMKERDLLIAQTLAFVQSVTGKLPEPDKTTVAPAATTTAAVTPVETPDPIRMAPLVDVTLPISDTASRPVELAPPLPAPVEPPLPIGEALPIVTHEEPKPAPVIAALSRPDLRVDFQSEIRARVASFRAHQERFSREREAYCSTTMAKVHASIREIAPPTNSGE